jgi:hypothetical protein
MKTILVCQLCYGISGCIDEKGHKKECVSCHLYLNGKLPCQIFLDATKVIKDYICKPCTEQMLTMRN